ncbi:hypothetical protein UPYG_G00329450 [Umbra pygmaea]|uniref:Cystatin domain-containing protein n=1 Tax=Umbra pygmaea TaxID=75934 RepID=A0ABD0W6F6_UMBPY
MIMDWRIIVPLLAVSFAAECASMPGGTIDADLNDRGVKNALEFAVVEHNKRTNDMFVWQVSNVVEAKTQVVAGMKYFFTVKMARTQCKKGGVETACSVNNDPQAAAAYECSFEVWSRPWISDIRLLKNTC